MTIVHIKPNAWIARLAAKKLSSPNVAIVFGRNIYLWGTSVNNFMNNKAWLRHELKHVEQYQRYGFLGFITKYIWQTLRVGYQRCGLECEARVAENDTAIIDQYEIVYKNDK